jgi:hypothetical protein
VLPKGHGEQTDDALVIAPKYPASLQVQSAKLVDPTEHVAPIGHAVQFIVVFMAFKMYPGLQ